MIEQKTTRRRVLWERAIWLVDLTAYGALAWAGVGALFWTQSYVIELVESREAIVVWGLLLMLGGAGALIGRASRFWAVEYVANVLVQWGALLYVLILIPAGAWGGRGVLLSFVVCAFLAALRRYAELKILTNEPGLDTFRRRLEAALRRRTGDTVPRERY